MNGQSGRFTFHPMRLGRVVRLLLMVLPLLAGVAAGADHPGPSAPTGVATLTTPRQSLPIPVHDEATCAFCQAAIFPPCAPHPAGISVESSGPVRRERAAVDAVAPHFTSHRPTSSRAPPSLRSV